MTTSSRTRSLRLLAGVALGLAASAASAQVAGSFQVTSFSYTVSGGTLSWLNGSAYQTQAAEAAEAGGLAGNDWDTSTLFALSDMTLSTSMPHANADSVATAAGLLSGQATATQSFIDPTSNPHYGTSMAQQSREFSLSQAGTVTFTLNYALQASALGGDALYTYSQAALDFAVGNYTSGVNSGSFIELLSFDLPGGAGTQSGTLSYSVTLAGANDVGFYDLRGNAYASATAAVPEPSTWLLLAAGMAGVAGVARRRGVRAQGGR